MSEAEVETPVEIPVPEVPMSSEIPASEDEILTSDQELAQVQATLREELAKVGVTDAHIEAWKERYGRVAAFPIYEQLYVVRPLNRGEWRLLMKGENSQNPSPEDLEESISALATLFPQLDISVLRTAEHAGIATALARSIEMISGFTPGLAPIVL
jgi:hypothetical protein